MPSLWSDATVPAATPVQAGGITTGTWMFADVDIWITSFRYYRTDTFSVGPHQGVIYSQAGAVLAQKTYTSEASGTGWRIQALDVALHLTAGTPFCAAIFSNTGDYAGTSGALTAQLDNAPLHAYAALAAPTGGNGVYATGGTATFPTNSFNDTAYFTDIVYQTSAPNVLPIAHAGIPQTIAGGSVVELDGSGSTDADGAITSYAWRQISGFSVILSSSSAIKPTFTAPLVTDEVMLTFGLKVTDDASEVSLENTVSVTVMPPATARYQLRAGVLQPVTDYRLTGGVLA